MNKKNYKSSDIELADIMVASRKLSSRNRNAVMVYIKQLQDDQDEASAIVNSLFNDIRDSNNENADIDIRASMADLGLNNISELLRKSQ